MVLEEDQPQWTKNVCNRQRNLHCHDHHKGSIPSLLNQHRQTMKALPNIPSSRAGCIQANLGEEEGKTCLVPTQVQHTTSSGVGVLNALELVGQLSCAGRPSSSLQPEQMILGVSYGHLWRLTCSCWRCVFGVDSYMERYVQPQCWWVDSSRNMKLSHLYTLFVVGVTVKRYLKLPE